MSGAYGTCYTNSTVRVCADKQACLAVKTGQATAQQQQAAHFSMLAPSANQGRCRKATLFVEQMMQRCTARHGLGIEASTSTGPAGTTAAAVATAYACVLCTQATTHALEDRQLQESNVEHCYMAIASSAAVGAAESHAALKSDGGWVRRGQHIEKVFDGNVALEVAAASALHHPAVACCVCTQALGCR